MASPALYSKHFWEGEMTGEKKLEQQIEEMRSRIEQMSETGAKLLKDVQAFQKEIKRQIDRSKRPK